MAAGSGPLPFPADDDRNTTLLLDVVLNKPVDEAFELLYTGVNDLRKRFNEAASNKDYQTTGWLADVGALDSALGQQPASSLDIAALKTGLMRKSAYSGVSMGSKFRTEELYKLVEAVPGSSYELHVQVTTTATYGDKFRPLLQHCLRAHGEGSSALTIRASLVFLTKVNGFIKGMIEKGVRDGMAKNFATFKQVLSSVVGVTEAAQAGRPPAAAGAAAPAAGEEAEAAPAAAAGLLETLVGADVCRRLDPWAAFLHERLSVLPPVQGLLEQQTLLVLLAGGLLLLGLRLMVDVLQFIQHASRDPQDRIAVLTHYVFRLIDVPDSTQEMVVACLLVYLVRVLVNRLAALLPEPPAMPAPGGSFAAGAGGASAPGGSPRGPAKRAKSEEIEAEGIKYEGYAEAIAGMQDGLSPLGARASGNGSDTDTALKHIKSSFSGLGKQVRALAKGNHIIRIEGPASARAASPTLEVAAAAAGNSGGHRKPAHHSKHRHRHKRSRDFDVPLDTSPLQTALSAGSLASLPSASDAEGPSGGPSDDADLPAALAGAGQQESGELAVDGSRPSLTRRLLGLGSPTKQPTSPQASMSAGAAAAPPSSMRSTTMVDEPVYIPNSEPQRDKAYLPAHLPPELAEVAVTDEIFENQRLQPFRGWGSTWPGHFLPTDRVSRWTVRESHDERGQLVIRGSSQVFGEVAPQLPEGWQWVEDSWHVDLSSVLAQAVDIEGWCYGLDFSSVIYPFPAGSGKKTLGCFVRRRRWTRTRVPLDVYDRLSASADAAAASAAAADAEAARALGLLLPSADGAQAGSAPPAETAGAQGAAAAAGVGAFEAGKEAAAVEGVMESMLEQVEAAGAAQQQEQEQPQQEGVHREGGSAAEPGERGEPRAEASFRSLATVHPGGEIQVEPNKGSEGAGSSKLTFATLTSAGSSTSSGGGTTADGATVRAPQPQAQPPPAARISPGPARLSPESPIGVPAVDAGHLDAGHVSLGRPRAHAAESTEGVRPVKAPLSPRRQQQQQQGQQQGHLQAAKLVVAPAAVIVTEITTAGSTGQFSQASTSDEHQQAVQAAAEGVHLPARQADAEPGSGTSEASKLSAASMEPAGKELSQEGAPSMPALGPLEAALTAVQAGES